MQLNRINWKAFRFEWGKRIHDPDDPYIVRWIFQTPLFAIKLHKWLKSDDLRYPHDHEASFVTYIISGGYTDIYQLPEDPSDFFRYDLLLAGEWAYRHYTHRHMVRNEYPVTWTLVLSGPVVNSKWGFWVNGKFRKRNKYFFEHGHH